MIDDLVDTYPMPDLVDTDPLPDPIDPELSPMVRQEPFSAPFDRSSGSVSWGHPTKAAGASDSSTPGASMYSDSFESMSSRDASGDPVDDPVVSAKRARLIEIKKEPDVKVEPPNDYPLGDDSPAQGADSSESSSPDGGEY